MSDALRAQLAAYLDGARLPCALAFRIAEERNVSLHDVREAADSLEIRISQCQLGLFGYDAYRQKRLTRRLAALPPSLEESVRAACTGSRLPCSTAWKIADDCGLPRLFFGSVAETLSVRISRCQLGCFE